MNLKVNVKNIILHQNQTNKNKKTKFTHCTFAELDKQTIKFWAGNKHAAPHPYTHYTRTHKLNNIHFVLLLILCHAISLMLQTERNLTVV